MDKKEHIHFHVKSQDFFGTYGTLIDILAQSLRSKKIDVFSALNVLDELKKDMIFMQDNYKVIPRNFEKEL